MKLFRPNKKHWGDLIKPAVGRGAAFGDIDNDGDIDIAISNNKGKQNYY
ncbi:MAG: hypothetical protein Ct9H300mP18_10140 [Candidatus Neomarinimicrobiota bacterium]|nr:MAG: hypothetical protein Ct9H300mP18_10140 [Candidatus Neomarinimicrobiota bacterium]